MENNATLSYLEGMKNGFLFILIVLALVFFVTIGREVLQLAIIATAVAITPWLLIYLVKRLIFKQQDHAYRAIKFHYLVILIGLVLAIPHFWMSHQLSPLSRQFCHECQTGNPELCRTGIETDGRDQVAANFGGALDRIVTKRNEVLAKHQFVRWGGWGYSTSGYSTRACYIYTFLPERTYKRLFPQTEEIR